MPKMKDIEKQSNYNAITQGTIWKQLLLFFFPIFLGSLFQQLYNTVDAIIVGQVLGKEALAAVGGGTGTIINLVIGFFTGLSSGATVIISQYYGSENNKKISLAIHNAAAIALWGGIAISIIGFFTAEPLLRLIGTTDDILPMAVNYLKIYYAGGVILVMYNIGSGIFRAFGDSKSPFFFLLAGCITNIVLDILLVGIFKMGVEGAAFATVFSQFVSLLCVIIKLRKRKDACRLYISKIKFESHMLTKTISIGLPAGIQSVLYGISNMIVQGHINGFGTNTAAAWAAYGKIDSLFWMIINSFGIAITTFAGQNYGAGLMDRAKKGVRQCLIMAFASSFLVEGIFLIAGPYAFRLFVSDRDVIDVGMLILRNIAPFFFCYVCVEILSGAVRGAGRTVFTTFATVFGICGFRVAYLAIVPKFNNSIPVVVACYALSWTITSIILIIYYRKADVFKLQ